MKDLVQVCFTVPAAVADVVAARLTDEGGGLEQRDHETSNDLSPETVELLVWLPESLVSARVQQVQTLLTSLEELGQAAKPWTWTSRPVQPEQWEEVYKRYFKTSHLGRYIVVKPSWEAYLPGVNDLVVELDPGMAFGTGLHASTVLVVHAMERMAHSQPAPRTVLDLGCGSGILSIAAAKLWPTTRVLAVDNDETAVQVCAENVQRNGLQSAITVEHGSAMELRGSYSLVLANLSAELLTQLQPTLSPHLEPFGHLVLSGMLDEQAPVVAQQFCRTLELEPEFSESLDGWRSYLLELRG